MLYSLHGSYLANRWPGRVTALQSTAHMRSRFENSSHLTQPAHVRHSVFPAATALQVAVMTLLTALSAVPAGAQASPSGDTSAPSGIFTEEVSVRVINVDVIVTDRSGRAVPGLGREDFELRVDGQPVPISNFYSEAGEVDRRTGRPAIPEQRRDPSFRSLEEIREGSPRRSHVVILVDHTRLRATNRKRAFAALRQAVDRLGDDDLVAVVGVESSLVFYSDFLFDRGAVHRILDDVSRVSLKTNVNEMERRRIFGELARGMSGGFQARVQIADGGQLLARIRSYATEEYQRGATLASADRIGGVDARRRARTQDSALCGRRYPNPTGRGYVRRVSQSLLRGRTWVAAPELQHGLHPRDRPLRPDAADGSAGRDRQPRQRHPLCDRRREQPQPGHPRRPSPSRGRFSEALSKIDENYRAPLEYATKATGGRLLQSAGTLADQLVDLVGGLRTFYSLGFTPPAGWQRGSDHDIKVKVKGKGLVVNHREEVRLPEPDEREAGATVAALMYQTVDNPLEIRAKPGFEVPREDGETAALPVNLEIPIKSLGFLPQEGSTEGGQTEGRQACSLSIYISIKDKDGNPGKIQKIPFHLAIPDDKMEEALESSAHYPLPLVLRRGDRQVAIGIRDNVNGQFSAIRLDVAQYSQF